MPDERNVCIFCERNSDAIPLVTLEYRRSHFQICTQHLPIIIHNPAELASVLPGAEDLEPSDHHD